MSALEIPQKELEEIVSLDEKKSITQINMDFENLKLLIEERLKEKKYNSIVTAQNLKNMKSEATELNKISKIVDNFKKSKIKAETTHIKIFEQNIKEIYNLIQEKRKEILSGIEKQEEGEKEEILRVCERCLELAYLGKNIREEFRTVDISDMTQKGYISAITKNITKKAVKEIEARLAPCIELQQKVDKRLLELKIECLEAGLSSALTQEHVKGFLKEPNDSEYKSHLKSLIKIELEREKKIEEKSEKNIDKNFKTTLEEKELDDEKVEREIVAKIKVPSYASKEQVIEAVINLIKLDKFPIENFELR